MVTVFFLVASSKCSHFSHFYFFYLSESSRGSHFSSSWGTLPSCFRCNTELKYIQSKPFYLLEIRWDFLIHYFSLSLRFKLYGHPPLPNSLFFAHLFSSKQAVEETTFSSFRERLHHLQVSVLFLKWIIACDDQFTNSFIGTLIWFQKTENERVCFGRSGIHGWGLFARRNIQEGEMVWMLSSKYDNITKTHDLLLCVSQSSVMYCFLF